MVWSIYYLYSWAYTILSLFKTNTSNETVSGGENKLSKQKIQNIRNPFISKMIKKEIKIEIRAKEKT